MTHAYSKRYGTGWLREVTTDKQSAAWAERATTEQRTRGPKGVSRVPNAGLAYANFYDLVLIAGKHWEPLATALGQRKTVLPLLERFDDLRNTIGHSRPLLPFEQDLMSGIAGQIRNQVTIYMSAQDEVGDIYPRIESITDSFGRRIESSAVDGEVAGSVQSLDIVVRPGDRVVFTCIGTDPQGRTLRWDLINPGYGVGQQEVTPSGEPAKLIWDVDDSDVNETAAVSISLFAHGAKYHRFGQFDHRAFFMFRVRPPAT